MTARDLVIVSGGLSQPSSTRLLADRLAEATAAALDQAATTANIEVIELRDHAHALTNNLLTGFASEELDAVKATITQADGVIAVSPIYSASYAGLFKNFFDVLDADALNGTPVLIAATAGTARHSLALEYAVRPLFTYLKAVTVPTAVFAASEDWGSGGKIEGGLAARIRVAAAQLAAAMIAAQPRSTADPYESLTPFEELLRG